MASTTTSRQAEQQLLRLGFGIEGTDMPGYSASLSDEQIWQVVTFMGTLDG